MRALREQLQRVIDEAARIDIGAYELNWPADVSVAKEVVVIIGEDQFDDVAVNLEQTVVYTITAVNAADSLTPATDVVVTEELQKFLTS